MGGVKYCVGKIPLYDVAFLSLKKNFFSDLGKLYHLVL